MDFTYHRALLSRALRHDMSFAAVLAAIALLLVLSCGQPSEPAAGAAVVELTPPPAINTVAPEADSQPAADQDQPTLDAVIRPPRRMQRRRLTRALPASSPTHRLPPPTTLL